MDPNLSSRVRRTFLWSVLLAVVVGVTVPLIGGTGMDYARVMNRQNPDWQILVNLRIPRVLLAMVTGAALSASGALFQALLRDALATPSNLGVSAAASLGAVAAIALLSGVDTAMPVVWICSLAGTSGVIAIVAALRASSRFSTLTLLLTGIAINGICASVILLLHSLAGITRGFQITHWLMGGIDAVPYSTIAAVLAVVTPVLTWVLLNGRQLNVMSYGDRWAAGRGIDCDRLTWQGFAAGALLVGVTTAVTGPISFVGLIVPHLLRRITSPDYRVLLPACIFCGAAFLAVCDTVSRTILAPVEVPVGVTTALLGGPFFVWLLWSR